MPDTLAHRAVIGVMTPAMNTVVQPELELLRPAGVTNQMQRFRLGGDAISKDLNTEASKLMDCTPVAIAIGLTTDAGPTLPQICETPLDDIRRVFAEVARADGDAILQVGTALPVMAMIAEREATHGRPIVACNAAVYWQTLRAAGIMDAIPGYGRLL